jgi:hypothetical protein
LPAGCPRGCSAAGRCDWRRKHLAHDGGHRAEVAAAAGLDHEAAARLRHGKELLEREDACRIKRDELAVAVPGGHVRSDPEFPQDS